VYHMCMRYPREHASLGEDFRRNAMVSVARAAANNRTDIIVF